MVSGNVDPEFEGVREEFTRNFAERGELGAACAVYHRGRKVVDLWGGSRNAAGQPWEHQGKMGECLAEGARPSFFRR